MVIVRGKIHGYATNEYKYHMCNHVPGTTYRVTNKASESGRAGSWAGIYQF